MLEKIFVKMREASRRVALAPDSQRSEALRRLAQLVEENMDNILRANALDLSKMDAANPLSVCAPSLPICDTWRRCPLPMGRWWRSAHSTMA